MAKVAGTDIHMAIMKVEIQKFVQTQATDKTTREQDEKDAFVQECSNRNEYLQQMHEQLVMSESKSKLRDRELIKTVWQNQAEMGQTGRHADYLTTNV